MINTTMPIKITFISFLIFLFVFLSWLAVFFHFGFFEAPAQGDEGDYLKRGLLIKESGFSVALGDGYRPPLFPSIITLLSYLVGDEYLLTAARINNILAVSLIPSMWFFLFLYERQERTAFLLMAIFTAIWLPYYYFSFLALAEALSFFFLNLLIILLLITRRHLSTTKVYFNVLLMSFIIASIFFLKANNILIAIPVGLFFLFFSQGIFRERFPRFLVLAGFSFLLILPWLLFVHSNTGEWKLTTTGGYNLLVGTGYHRFGMKPDYRALPARYMYKTHGDYPKLDPKNRLLLDRAPSLSKSELDDVAKELALKIWSNDPKEQAIHGVMKVLHSYGFSFRHGLDYFTASFFLLVLVASLVMYVRFPQTRPLMFLHWGIALSGLIVAYFWLPNIRFKVFYFDATGLLMLSFLVQMWASRILISTKAPHAARSAGSVRGRQ